MKINDFEKYFNGQVLSRGKRYFLDKNVLSVTSVGRDEYEIDVEGSELYTVSVVMMDDSINDITCDCPYDYDDHCKHQAAALFKLREMFNEESGFKFKKSFVKQDLRSALDRLSREKLIDIILNRAEDDEAFKNLLEIEYSDGKSADDITSVFINAVKKSKSNKRYERQYHEYDSDMVIDAAEKTIQKSELIENLCERAKIYIFIIDELDEIISGDRYLYDGNGWDLLAPVNKCVNKIQEISKKVIENDNADEIDMFWNILIDSYREENAYYGGEDHWFPMMLPFCKFPQYCEELKKLQNLSDDMTYKSETSAKKYYKIIKEFGADRESENFISDNTHFSFFRRLAISNAIEGKEYEKAERLAFEGEIQDQDKRNYGLIKEWRIFRYSIYKKLNETDKLIIVCRQLIIEGYSEYYHEWKSLIDKNKFDEEIKTILEKVNDGVYTYIITQENMTEKIYDHCLKKSCNIVSMYSYLKNTEFEELGREVYEGYIYAIAEKASDRSRYTEVCDIISAYTQECGERYSNPIIADLKEKNRRRPAFIDELSKIKK